MKHIELLNKNIKIYEENLNFFFLPHFLSQNAFPGISFGLKKILLPNFVVHCCYFAQYILVLIWIVLKSLKAFVLKNVSLKGKR